MQQTNGAFIGNTITGYGGAFGYERRVTTDLSLGGFVGASTSTTQLNLNAGGADTEATFAGFYGRASRGATFLDFALIGGMLDNTTTRDISGGLAPQAASAAFNGWFINPALTLGHRFALDHGFTLTPAIKIRDVAANFDGYTETGSSANLTVGSRTVQELEERLQATLAYVGYIDASRVILQVTGGALSQQRTSGSAINIALLGQNLVATTPDAQNVNGLFASTGVEWQFGRVALFAAAETTATDDSTRIYTGHGGVRVTW